MKRSMSKFRGNNGSSAPSYPQDSVEPKEPTCNECRYWMRITAIKEDGSVVGYCHNPILKYSPSYSRTPTRTSLFHSYTSATFTCPMFVFKIT